jgi:hypothetical protein
VTNPKARRPKVERAGRKGQDQMSAAVLAVVLLRGAAMLAVAAVFWGDL